MAEAYWTHCMYCRGVICGVEMLKEYDDIVVLYAHKTCHEERRPMDPNALWKDLRNELRALERFPDNRDLRLHVCSLLDALSTWIRRNGFPPTISEGPVSIDPNTLWWTLQGTLRELHTIDDQEHRNRSVALLELLAQWLNRGGYPPQV